MIANELERTWLAGALVAFSVTTAMVGCETAEPTGDSSTSTSQSSSSTGTSASTGSAMVCVAALDDACGECMQSACCESLQACEQDQACWDCVTAVDGEACESSEETHARVDAFLTCRGGSCQSPCIGTPAGGCEGVLEDVVAPDCQACLEAQCCNEVAGCYGSEGCWISCFTMHDEADCHADADGHAIYHAMGSCAADACAAECL